MSLMRHRCDTVLLLLLCGCLMNSAPFASAANFWLSASNDVATGSEPPTSQMDIPRIERGLNDTSSFYIWAKPDPGEVLLNWSLNLVSSNANALQFQASDVSTFNPVLNATTNERRWEFVGEPGTASLTPDGLMLNRVMGFSFQFDTLDIGYSGVGIGSGLTSSGNDPFAANNSWLIAKVNYRTGSQVGSTDIYLQIGDAGINHLGDSSAMTDVVLGALSDPPLNAGVGGRNAKSFTPELVIVVSDSFEDSADFNGDGETDGADFLSWQRGYSPNPLSASELVSWQANYGAVSPLAVYQAVPEPSGTLLVTMYLMVVSYRTRSALRPTWYFS